MNNLMMRQTNAVANLQPKASMLQRLIRFLAALVKIILQVAVIMAVIYALGVLARILVLPVSIILLVSFINQTFRK